MEVCKTSLKLIARTTTIEICRTAIPTTQVLEHDVLMEEEIEIEISMPMSAGSLYPLVSGTVSAVEGIVGLARFSTETCVQLATEASKSALNALLDAVVPVAVNAVVSRVNLTEIVVQNVDINTIVARADINPILDRIPMTEIADYVIEEIDLPTLVRESTGGVADDILGILRFQAIETDNFITSVVDKVLFRNKTQSAKKYTELDLS